MKLTKLKLKRIIKEELQKEGRLSDFGEGFMEKELKSWRDIRGENPHQDKQSSQPVDPVDEEEKREWDDMIEKDVNALHTTLEGASDALDGLPPHQEELLGTLSRIQSDHY